MKNFFTKAIVCAGVMASVMALSSVAAFAAITTDKTWTISEWQSGQTIPTSGSITKDDLTYYGRSNSKYNESQNATFDGTKITGSISTGGGSTISTSSQAGVFAFTPAVDGTVKIYAASGGSSSRSLYVGQGLTSTNKSLTSSLGSKTQDNDTSGFILTTSKAAKDNTVYIYTDNNFHFYKIEFVSASTDPIASVDKESTTIAIGAEDVITADSSNITDAVYTWSDSNDIVSVTPDATDSKKATIKGLSADTTTVTVTVTGKDANGTAVTKTASTEVEVIAPVDVETVTVKGNSNVNLGYAVELEASVSPDNATDKTVTWSTESTNVALSATEGNSIKVRGLAAGKATVKATAGGVSKEFDIEVAAPSAVVIGSTEKLTFDLTKAGSTGFGVAKEVITNGTIIDDSFKVVQTAGATGETTSAIINSSTLQIGATNNSYVEFTTNKTFKVDVEFSSTGGSNVSNIVILNESGEVVKLGSQTGTSKVKLTVDSLPKGTYKIAAPTADQGAEGVGETTTDSSGKTSSAPDATARGARLYSVTFEAAELEDAEYTATNNSGSKVIVKNGTVYAIGKVQIADINAVADNTATLTVGNKPVEGITEVFSAVSINNEEAVAAETGYYFVGVVVNGVPSNEAAEALANSITLEVK